jgi:HIV-1 Vpr-binding protein
LFFRVLRPGEEDQFTTAAFSPCNQWTIVGTHQGEVKLFNISTGNEDGTYNCHDSEVYHIQPNTKGNLLLTSSVWRRPLSCLWKMESLFDKIMEFDREEYVEFSKLNQDKVIATNMDQCFVYDIETKKKIFTAEPRMSNQYVKNRATFDPTDELILSDGILWDFRSGKEIHKFDKLNDNISGVFHPVGLEIIANTEVWDVRTFKLLKTVRDLDQCVLEFTHDGTVIYGVRSEREADDGFRMAETSFITMDATDYERIATIELKRYHIILWFSS